MNCMYDKELLPCKYDMVKQRHSSNEIFLIFDNLRNETTLNITRNPALESSHTFVASKKSVMDRARIYK